MPFYDNYLKRANRNGNTMQERILTQKEREFEKLTLPKSIYLSTIESVDGEEESEPCILQPHKYNQEKEINNLMVKKSFPLSVGTELTVVQKIDDREKTSQLLITFHENNITYGYLKYEGILLDDEFTILDAYDEEVSTFYCKIFNASNKFFADNFRDINGAALKSATKNRINLVCKDNEYLKKDLYVEFGQMAWRIEGIDRLSIPNIAYVSLEETLKVAKEDENNKELVIDENTNYWLNGLDGDVK